MDRLSLRFLLTTYGLTWLLWLPAVIQSFRGIPLSPLVMGIGIPGMLVPSVMGLVFLRRENRFPNVFRQLFQWRWNRWLLLSIILLPAVVVLTHGIQVFVLGRTAPSIEQPERLPLLFLSTLVAGGPLFEEIGWRGYLQGRLLKRHSVLVTGLLMGLFWGIWHIPLFMIKGMFHEHIPLDQFAITVVLMSIIICTLQVRAKSGIWPALILHTFMNLTQEVTPLFDEKGHLPWTITNGILLLVVVATSIFPVKSLENPVLQEP